MFPLIPIICIAVMATSGGGLYWYTRLPEHKQREADRLAHGYARQMFDKALEQLAHHEASHVHRLVKKHFVD